MSKKASNFIRHIVANDIKNNVNDGKVMTRFPPEPNGYLHIGHAKSICLNFGIAQEFDGHCNLRFDDTNPAKESTEFAESIKQDVSWLGFKWHGDVHYASDYFEALYNYAEQLIKDGRAYVDSSTADEIREMRGTLTEPGVNSPYRDRPAEESLDLFRRMRAGEFEDGAHVLRARIDMQSPNINMRDPLIYRIRHVEHHRTGDQWCIYPLYDFTHCLSDAQEHITHSLCSLEFEDHRPLYDWFVENLPVPARPRQYEFSRLNLKYTVMSKRKLAQLVEEGHVDGWDDPRMPTISGMRRRGYTPASLREFCERIGVTKKVNTVEMGVLEHAVREDLDATAPRASVVLDPIKIVLTTYPEGETEYLDMPNHPKDDTMGVRQVPFSREIYIEREDFMEDPPAKYFRLRPGGEVRLRRAYIIKCEEVIKNEAGDVVELRCSHDPNSRSGMEGSKRKVKGIIHWVSAPHAVDATVRVYDRLFVRGNPDSAKDERPFTDYLNPDSLAVIEGAKAEPSLSKAKPEQGYQFERLGYFCADRYDHSADQLVFNRTVTLRDTWAKIEAADG